jgi:hypothetical protein
MFLFGRRGRGLSRMLSADNEAGPNLALTSLGLLHHPTNNSAAGARCGCFSRFGANRWQMRFDAENLFSIVDIWCKNGFRFLCRIRELDAEQPEGYG